MSRGTLFTRFRRALSGALGLALPVITSTGCVGQPPDDVPALEGSEPVQIESKGHQAMATVVLEGDTLVQGSNNVDVTLEAEDGTTDVVLVDASAFMPAHGHGTTDPVVTDEGDHYRVEDLNLFMPGHWEITLDVKVGDAQDSFFFVAEIQ